MRGFVSGPLMDDKHFEMLFFSAKTQVARILTADAVQTNRPANTGFRILRPKDRFVLLKCLSESDLLDVL